MDYVFDAVSTKERCVSWIRDWFKDNGNGCNAVVGISGGKDSTVVAALCAEALGKDRVIGVLMPNGLQPDIDDAEEVVWRLGIRSVCINIIGAVEDISFNLRNGYLDTIYEDGSIDTERFSMSEQAQINLPARIRMATLYAVSQSLHGRVANTCNLSEDWIGYSTRYGDGAGDFAPLGNLTSDWVVEIGKLYKDIPERLICKVPSDGLCGKTDEDNFGFTYDVLNRYIHTGECDDPEIKEKIDCLHEKNKFKLKPIPCFHMTATKERE